MANRSPRLLTAAGLLLLLAGCQHQVQPSSAPSVPVVTGQQLEQLGQLQEQRFGSLEQQLTLLQEKLLKLNDQLERLDLQGRQQLALTQHIQQLQSSQMALGGPSQRQTSAASSGNDTLAQLTELVLRLEQMSSQHDDTDLQQQDSTAPDYRLVSAYGTQGWVLLKYDAVSGTSWKAEGGDWKEIKEVGVLPDSQYRLVIQAAENDVKGFVAARIDRSNGFAWWLKGNTWEPL